MADPRAILLQCFQAGLTRVGGREAVRQFLLTENDSRPTHLVSVGKAAAMAMGALDVLGDAIQDGIVISKTGHIDENLRAVSRLHCLESDHPFPTQRSLEAGRELVSYIQTRAGKNKRFLFLLSGGASSLVEVLADGVTLDDLSKLNSILLANGFDITRINVARRALSRIKGGRLAGYLGKSETLGLLISDVPGDNPGVIGSGLLTPSHDDLSWDEYPEEVQTILRNANMEDIPKANTFARVRTQIIARLEDAKQAAATEARRLGYPVTVHDEFVSRDAEIVGAELADYLAVAQPGVHIWGGETSVVLPSNPGRGGRNQHLALAVASHLSSQKNIWFLSAGTDGTDGTTDDAGGIIDGDTVARGEAHGLTATDFLNAANANAFLSATGDLVHTGPTGTNVMDLMIGLVTQTDSAD